jgi:hypothetical protein
VNVALRTRRRSTRRKQDHAIRQPRGADPRQSNLSSPAGSRPDVRLIRLCACFVVRLRLPIRTSGALAPTRSCRDIRPVRAALTLRRLLLTFAWLLRRTLRRTCRSSGRGVFRGGAFGITRGHSQGITPCACDVYTFASHRPAKDTHRAAGVLASLGAISAKWIINVPRKCETSDGQAVWEIKFIDSRVFCCQPLQKKLPKNDGHSRARHARM